MKRLLATVATALLIGGIPLPVAAQPTGDTIEIEITDMSAVHTPGDSLPVTVTLTNGGKPVDDVPLRLTVQSSVPLYRSTVNSWMADENVNVQMLTLDQRTIDIPSGTTTVDIEVPADILTWGNTSATWGPRGVEATLGLDSGSITDRSLLITEPSFEQEPMSFTVLYPVTTSHDDLANIPYTSDRYEASMEALTAGELGNDEELPDPLVESMQAATGRVTDTLAEITEPGITVALDSAFASFEYGTIDSTVEALNTYTDGDGHELVLLPALDADLTAWADTGADQFFRVHYDQAERTEAALDQHNITSRRDVLLTPGPLTASVAELGTQNGINLLVAQQQDVPLVNEHSWTPSARTTVSDTDAVVVDEDLSELLTDTGDLSDLDRRQLLLAVTAIHYRERPNDPRPLVLSLPRSDSATYSASTVNDLVSALNDTSWMSGATLTDIEQSPVDSFEREELADISVSGNSVSTELLNNLQDWAIDIFTVGDLTTHPHLFRDAVESTSMIAGSWVWTQAPHELVDRIASVHGLSADLAASLQVQESSTINLISQASEFPVHVTSTLPIPITVAIEVDSEDRRLRFEPVSTTLRPNTTTTVPVPVKAVGSGNVITRVEIVGPVGQVIGTGTDINIRVRADWENMGTAALAGLFLVILIVGVIRSARRGTRTQPVSEADAIDLED